MATDNPSDGKTALGDDVSIELPAPAGWKKKFTPKKGATPGRNEVVFIAPDGEEIKSKTQLKLYLKSHSADVTVKEFDWSTGDTPRRSARLSEKSKVSESPDNDTPRKRQRKSSSKEVTKENDDASEDEASSECAKAATEVSNADAEGTVEQDKREVVTEKALHEKDGGKDPVGEPAAEEEKAAAEEPKEQEVAAEEHKTADEKMDVQLGTSDNEAADMVKEDVQLQPNDEDTGTGSGMNKEEGNEISNGEEGVENTSFPCAVSEEANKGENVPSGAEVVNVTTTHEADMFLDAVGDELSTEADAKAEESAADKPKYTSDPKVETADADPKDSLTKDEAVGKDTPMQEAREDLPS